MVASLALAGCCSRPTIPRTYGELMVAIARDVAPPVARIMETSAHVTLHVQPIDEPDVYGQTSVGNDVIIIDPDLKNRGPVASWHFVMAHELAHAHARGYWETLPHWLEEGLADLVALEVVPEAQEGARSVRPEDRVHAYEVAATLGIERLRALAKRAHREGLEEIPTEWLEE